MSNLVAGLLGVIVGIILGVGPLALYFYAKRRELLQRLATRPMLEEQTRDVLGKLGSAVVMVGPHDEILHASPAAYTIGLVKGNRMGVPALLELVRTVRATDVPVTRDFKLSGVLGVPARELSVRINPLDRDCVLLAADDQTALLRIDESKRDFVANVSHELKTPVGALQVLAEAAGEAADDPEAVVHFVNRMRIEASRLSELVGQIIDLSRLQSDGPMIISDAVSVDDLVTAAVGSCEQQAAARGVSITVTGTEGLSVTGDVQQLISALVNLVQNAIAYSDAGARVVITTQQITEADQKFVELKVADNGIGIKPEDQERIFERFYRVDYARSRDNGGTGLGLSIVKHIVAAHGGTISVWSAPGQGSTFTISLPASVTQGVQ